jgi:hypothetical protein
MSARAEQWRSIPGFKHYEASTHGRIRSWHVMGGSKETRRAEPHVLRPGINAKGYRLVCLVKTAKSGARKMERVHRLVLLTFIGPPPTPQHQGSHLNDDPSDNRLANLCWETREQNWARRGL